MTFFSTNFIQARQKFGQSARNAGASVAAIPLPDGYEVDVATWGETSKPTLIITSGLHGVEGYFGSAVQIAAMQYLFSGNDSKVNLKNSRVVFVHGINPYGFDRIRRVDENNVDLNRNFFLSAENYRGSSTAYGKLDRFLNPTSPPALFEPFRLKASLHFLRYGIPALKEAIVSGQFEYPQGVFYGGREPASVTKLVMEQCETWVGESEVVAHIDLHTGLGNFGEYKILLGAHTPAEKYRWYKNTFGEEFVAELQSDDNTAYSVIGGMGEWLQHRFNDRQYFFAGAEFGTYGPIRVVGALRAENRAHYFASDQSSVYKKSKAELLECFCPASAQWRRNTIDASLRIIDAAITGLHHSRSSK